MSASDRAGSPLSGRTFGSCWLLESSASPWPGSFVVAAFLLSKLAPSQREFAWDKGAEGEERVGANLDALATDTTRVLHDRLMPGSRANIDHLVVSPAGVWTVETKYYKGRVEVRRGRELRVNGRDRSKLVAQARRQAEAVQKKLTSAGHADVVVLPVLCFVGAEWPLLFPPRKVGDVRLVSPRRLEGLFRSAEIRLRPRVVGEVAAILDAALKSAVHPEAPSRESLGLEMARDDERVTPTCACGADMVIRTRRQDGHRFLGCSTFPVCRRTRPAT